MSDERPIGVFDSGVGGLTVVAALKRRLPRESVLYLGDTARLPYGTKSPLTVERYSRRNVDFLASRGVKAVVVACNTASALGLAGLKEPVPVLGVIEPGAHRAAEISQGSVGVLATESTIASDAYGTALRAARSDLRVVSQPCPLFVPLIEEGWYDDSVTAEVARRYLQPLIEQRVDTVILGCTHYPLLADLLAGLLGSEVQLVDSAGVVAERLHQDLEASGALASESEVEDHYCVTDAGSRFRRIAADFLGDPDLSLELVEVS